MTPPPPADSITIERNGHRWKLTGVRAAIGLAVALAGVVGGYAGTRAGGAGLEQRVTRLEDDCRDRDKILRDIHADVRWLVKRHEAEDAKHK
jgi:hypothetical protein